MARPDGPKEVYPPQLGDGELPVGGGHHRDGRLSRRSVAMLC